MNPYSNKVFSQAQFKNGDTPQEILSEIPTDGHDFFSVRYRTPLILFAVAILVLCLLILPWPTRIDLSLPGGRIDADGTLLQEGTVRLEGWQYNYLLRRDTMKVSVDVMDLTLSQTRWEKQNFYTGVLGPFRHMTQLIHVSELGGYELSHITIAIDDSWYLVKIGPNLYIGSENPAMDAGAIVDLCQPFIS